MASSMIDNDALYKLAVEMKEDKSQLVSIVYRILDSLAAQDMSYVARVPPPNMGIHPDNRAGKTNARCRYGQQRCENRQCRIHL